MDKAISSGGKTIIPWKLGGSKQNQDMFLVYEFMKRLLIPYNQWEAYSTGVIDAKGNILVDKHHRNSRQNKSFGNFDNLVIKLRKLLDTAPTAKNKLLPATAALYLLREYQMDSEAEEIDESIFNNILQQLSESAAPVNSVGGGQIAGLGVGPQGEPGRKRVKVLKRKKLMEQEQPKVVYKHPRDLLNVRQWHRLRNHPDYKTYIDHPTHKIYARHEGDQKYTTKIVTANSQQKYKMTINMSTNGAHLSHTIHRTDGPDMLGHTVWHPVK